MVLRIKFGEIECRERIILKYYLKKQVLGQIIDIIDSGESLIKTQNRCTLEILLTLDISMLYPGSFTVGFEAHSDLGGKMTAVDCLDWPFEIEGEGRLGVLRVFRTVESFLTN